VGPVTRPMAARVATLPARVAVARSLRTRSNTRFTSTRPGTHSPCTSTAIRSGGGSGERTGVIKKTNRDRCPKATCDASVLCVELGRLILPQSTLQRLQVQNEQPSVRPQLATRFVTSGSARASNLAAESPELSAIRRPRSLTSQSFGGHSRWHAHPRPDGHAPNDRNTGARRHRGRCRRVKNRGPSHDLILFSIRPTVRLRGSQ
jgi:hypothetical protein